MLKLICASFGNQRIFVVDINRQQVVAELKEEIRLMACMLGGWATRDIDLFLAKQRGQPDSPWVEFNDELAQIQQLAPNEQLDVSKAVKATYMKDALLLNPLRQLGWYFADLPESGVVHVLVRFCCYKALKFRSIRLAFTPMAVDPKWKDKVFEECRQRRLSAMGYEAMPNMLQSVECLESPGADDLAYRQKLAVARELQTKLARGEKLLGPEWLLDKYFTGVPSEHICLILVTVNAPNCHVRRVKVDAKPTRLLEAAHKPPSQSEQPPRSSSIPWLLSWWRWFRRSASQESKKQLLGSRPSSKR